MYQVAYGLDTDSIEDPRQMVLLSVPDEWASLDPADFCAAVADEWTTGKVKTDPLVPLEHILDRVVLAMLTEGVDRETAAQVRETVRDAVDNAA